MLQISVLDSDILQEEFINSKGDITEFFLTIKSLKFFREEKIDAKRPHPKFLTGKYEYGSFQNIEIKTKELKKIK